MLLSINEYKYLLEKAKITTSDLKKELAKIKNDVSSDSDTDIEELPSSNENGTNIFLTPPQRTNNNNTTSTRPIITPSPPKKILKHKISSSPSTSPQLKKKRLVFEDESDTS